MTTPDAGAGALSQHELEKARTERGVWSTSDFPYACLKDRGRTEALMRAVGQIVRPGDSVVDLGSGTGILALTAASRGADRVVAVELDPMMASTLRRTVTANGFDQVIQVVEADARELTGIHADVLLAEIIDTGLAEEPFVPVMNAMWGAGVVDASTRLLFERYTTLVQLVLTDHEYYGFTILAPKNEWPLYESEQAGSGWWPTSWRSVSEAIELGTWDFRHGPVEPTVDARLPIGSLDGIPNALLLSGVAHLGDGQHLGAYNTFNGLKLLAIDDVGVDEASELRLRFVMGGGLQSVDLRSATTIDLRD